MLIGRRSFLRGLIGSAAAAARGVDFGRPPDRTGVIYVQNVDTERKTVTFTMEPPYDFPIGVQRYSAKDGGQMVFYPVDRKLKRELDKITTDIARTLDAFGRTTIAVEDA